jgi:hypothetical protein
MATSPQILHHGFSLPVQVDASIWRPWRVHLFGSGFNETPDTRLTSCAGKYAKCSCQRIMNQWPIQYVTRHHKSLISPSTITNIRSGKVESIRMIVEAFKKKPQGAWPESNGKRWKSIQFGDMDIPLADIRGVQLSEGKLEIIMTDPIR